MLTPINRSINSYLSLHIHTEHIITFLESNFTLSEIINNCDCQNQLMLQTYSNRVSCSKPDLLEYLKEYSMILITTFYDTNRKIFEKVFFTISVDSIFFFCSNYAWFCTPPLLQRLLCLINSWTQEFLLTITLIS